MAVYTRVPDRLLSDFIAGYEIGDFCRATGIAEGVENSNYLIETTQGRYILTLYEKRVQASDLPFFLGLMQHVAAKDLAVPLPVSNKNGDVLQMLCDRPAALVSFLDGKSDPVPDVDQCRQLGQVLGQFHLAAQDFPIQRDNALGPAAWPDLFARCQEFFDKPDVDLPPGFDRPAQQEVAAALDHITRHWPDNLPSGVIHADLFPNNVFFKNKRLSGLIDFYFACQDFLAYDLAVSVNSWCFPPDRLFNVQKAAAIIAGYDSVRKLSEKERASFPLLCAGSSLRFFLTRLYDWIMTPPDAYVNKHDPMEYLDYLRFHMSSLHSPERNQIYGLAGH